MAPVVNFYMDDSGTRKPDRAAMTFDPEYPNYFALGGVLILDRDEAEARAAYDALCAQWGITYPLHSVDIRHAAKDFTWLRRGSPEYEPFMRDLTRMLTRIPVTGLACVIDRPGYDARYRPKYGRNQWHLCQTAFSIAVERAAKHALSMGCRLRVLPERGPKADDTRLEGYYNNLRACGLPFDNANSGRYSPLGAKELNESLIELRFKRKSSPLVQIADLYLWPILMERYRPGSRSYAALRDAGRLIECALRADEIGARGSKYSCFELVDRAASCAA
jgi:Protein of unknown function (DUF3800)